MPARDITRLLLSMSIVALASCALTTRVRAQPEIDLLWLPAEGCPDRAEIAERIETQLGRALRDVDTTLRVTARIRHTDTGYTLALRTELGDTQGTRTFSAPRCDEVAEAAVLVIALSLDEAETERDEVRPTASAHAAPVVPAPVGPAPVGPAPTRRTRYTLRGAGLLESGSLPRTSLGAEGALSVGFGRARVELSGLWLAPRQSSPARDGGRVEVSLWTARASYCHHLAGGHNRLGGCLGVELGQMTAQGRALAEANRRHALWSAGHFAVRFSSQLHERVALVLEPSLAVALTRRRLVSSDVNAERLATLHTPKATSKRVTFGIELSF